MIRSVNAAHLHSHSPSCFLAGCRGSPSLCPPPPSPPPLSPHPLAHIFWNGGADAACVWVCVFLPRAALSGTDVAIAWSHWEQRSLDGERARYLAQLTGATTASPAHRCSCPDKCKWDSDLTMVPFLWTSFETPGGGKGGNLKISVWVL